VPDPKATTCSIAREDSFRLGADGSRVFLQWGLPWECGVAVLPSPVSALVSRQLQGRKARTQAEGKSSCATN